MNKYGLIGYPLTHSFSAGYFKDKFEKEHIVHTSYELFSIDSIEKILDIISPDIKGLNVTIPYKEQVLQYVDIQSDAVQKIGAANTLHFTDEGVVAHNTDVYGFEKSLLENFDIKSSTKALILGTGGAAKAVAYVMDRLCIPFQYVSRQKGYLNYQDLDKNIIEEHQLIVNTSPLGTYPNIEASPNIPYSYLTQHHMLFDLVYNPAVTSFLRQGKEQRCATLNGYNMLVYQAEKSWDIWNNIL